MKTKLKNTHNVTIIIWIYLNCIIYIAVYYNFSYNIINKERGTSRHTKSDDDISQY